MTTLDPRSCYKALRSKDYRYDGRFFLGVRTTGIYCRPICPARAALFKNVTFYRTAAEAAEQGFRPCKRCRPESAAGSPLWNGTSTTVSRALKLIDEGFLGDRGVGELAETLGLGERHLRSLFVQHVGVAPKSLADTKRLDFAKNLIDTTGLPMTEIAYASGFASIRRFNDAIKKRYRAAPSELRRAVPEDEPRSVPRNGIVTYLAYRPPYDWQRMMRYLRDRSLGGIEILDGFTYSRSFRLADATGWLRIRPEVDRHRIKVEVFGSRALALMQITRRIRNLFDLNADPMLISSALSADAVMKPLVDRFPGTRLPGSWDGYETAVRTIVGQLISIKAAASIATRLVERYGERIATAEGTAPTLLFPEPRTLARARLERIGLTGTKAGAVRALSRMVLDERIRFDGIVDFRDLRDRLLEIPGVGPWTADYVTLRLSDPDAFPRSDLVIARCLKEFGSDGAAWQPWRGYATHYLWRWYAEDRELHR